MAKTPKAKSKLKRITISFDGFEQLAEFGAPVWRFVVAASHDGPYEIRALVVNDVAVVGPPRTNQGERIMAVPLPAVVVPPFRVLWWITAGHTIPKIAVALAFGTGAPAVVEDKKPLKKGESWITNKPVAFPKP